MYLRIDNKNENAQTQSMNSSTPKNYGNKNQQDQTSNNLQSKNVYPDKSAGQSRSDSRQPTQSSTPQAKPSAPQPAQTIKQDKKIKTQKPQNPFGARTMYESEDSSSQSDSDSGSSHNSDIQKRDKSQLIQPTPQAPQIQQKSNFIQISEQPIRTPPLEQRLKNVTSIPPPPGPPPPQNIDQIINQFQPRMIDSQKSQSLQPQSQPINAPVKDIINGQVFNQPLQENPSSLRNILNQIQEASKEKQPLSQSFIQEAQINEQTLTQKNTLSSSMVLPPPSPVIPNQNNIENIKDPRLKRKFMQEQKKSNFDQTLQSLQNKAVLLQNMGCIQFDEPLRVLSHIYCNGQLFFKVSWKPRKSDKVQMQPTFIEYDKVKVNYPSIFDKYMLTILSSKAIQF